MLPDDLVRRLAHALPARADSDPRVEASAWEHRVPSDVARLLSAVAGRRCGEHRFLSLAELEALRESSSTRAARFEGGGSDNACDALWNASWYPLARSETDVYAYDPSGCFRGRPAQIVWFEVEGGEAWRVFPSIRGWLAALVEALEQGPEPDAFSTAHRRTRARRQLFEIRLPETRDEQRSTQRWSLPRSTFNVVGDEHGFADFRLFVSYALSRGLDSRWALGEIARALAASQPYCGLEQLATAELVDAEPLGRAWLGPYLAKHAARKGVSRIVFDMDADADGLRLWVALCVPGQRAVRSATTSTDVRCFEALQQLVEASDVAWCTDEVASFRTAAAGLLIAAMLETCARSLPENLELDVEYREWQVGRCDRDGFVPTPCAITLDSLRSHRTKYAAGLARMGFPGTVSYRDYPVPERAWTTSRSLHHPDGRSWEVTVRGDTWQCTMVEPDGERETFSRPIKTGWEVETLIAAQRRAGFVET